MITSEEFFRQKLKEIYPFKEVITLSMELISAEQGMRWGYEYSILKSKFHVEMALKEASKNVIINNYHNEGGIKVCKNSILNAYPLDNIK